ncbi:unnamed protein product [Soboliphyme baturini]|uniref:DOMON domain-containing protein n=1 Tax=Soboliphyme baturini TaxID=241478 RepID=A0A183J1E4_9BILA|nr:unnamed protein product [Soboliphyme baturini]
MPLSIQAVAWNLEAISFDDCNKTKSCLFSPANCDPAVNCVTILTFKPEQDYVDFEASTVELAQGPLDSKYIAVGFSDDQEMGDDSVTYCQYQAHDNSVSVALGFNLGHAVNVPIGNEDTVSLLEGGVINSTLVCRFRQKIIPTKKSKYIRPLNESYFLFLTTGPVMPDGKLTVHALDHDMDNFPYISDHKINLVALGGAIANAEPYVSEHTTAKTILKKTHGKLKSTVFISKQRLISQ